MRPWHCLLAAFLSLAAAPAWAQQSGEVQPPPPLPPPEARPAGPSGEARETGSAPAAVGQTAPPTVRRAADDGEDVPIPPKVLDDRAQVEPTVEIRRDEEDNIVEEYMLEGRVYMVKVTPKNGVPYYYLDADGDGQLELRESDRSRGFGPVRPVYWKIKEW